MSFKAKSLLVGALALLCLFVLQATTRHQSQTASIATSDGKSDAITDSSTDPDEEKQMQRWMHRHKEADHDDAEAAEEIATFRWSAKDAPGRPHGPVKIGRSHRTIGGVYCLDYKIIDHGTITAGRAYIWRDPSFNKSMWLEAETASWFDQTRPSSAEFKREMSKASDQWEAQWNLKCRDAVIAKDTTAYLSNDLLPATNEFK